MACFGPLTGIPAVVYGAIAIRRIRASGGELGGEGYAIAGIGMGLATVVLTAILALLVAIIAAVPELRNIYLDAIRDIAGSGR